MKIVTLFTLLFAFVSCLPAQQRSPWDAFTEKGELAENCRQFNKRIFQKTAGPQTDLPTLCYAFDWDTTGAVWDSVYRYQTSHVMAAGEYRLASDIQSSYISNAWNIDYRDEFGYDAMGNRNYILTQLWNGTAFDDFGRSTRNHDAWGAEIETVYEEYDGSVWDSIQHQRQAISYNSQNQPTEQVFELRNFPSTNWLLFFRVVSNYNSNDELSIESSFSWNGSQWTPSFRSRGYVWQDYSKDRYSEVFEDDWNGSAYVPYSHETRTYTDTLGSFNGTYSLYNTTTQAFDSSYKYTDEYDAMGNRIHYELYIWDTATSAFILQAAERYTLTYNSWGEIVDGILEFKAGPSEPWVNSQRYTCVEFVVGTAPEAPETSFANWASHPVGQTADLVVEGRPGNVAVEVSSLDGKMLRRIEQPHAGGVQQHAIELGLPVGMYLYHVELGGKSVTGKLFVNE